MGPKPYVDNFFHRAVGLRVCYLTHPDYIEDVLVTRNHNFVKGMGIRVNPRLFGQGLLTSEGDQWWRQRRLMQPAFHRRNIGLYARVMVECTQKMLSSWQPGDIRDLRSEIDHLTLETIARVLFDLDFTEHIGPLEAAARAFHARTARGSALVYAMRYLPSQTNLRYLRVVGRLEKIIYRIIRRRRASDRSSDDLLSTLLQARDDDGQAMNDRQVRDELMTLIGAGYDTTSLTLCYRLYPPGWVLVREANEAFEVGGYRLPPRTNFVLCSWIVQRDSRFYDEPHAFRPQRWTEEFERQLPKFAYFPFGGGQRTCIGTSLAKMQTSLMLATMAQRFRISLKPGFKLRLLPTITLPPKHGISVIIQHRLPKQRISMDAAAAVAASAPGPSRPVNVQRCFGGAGPQLAESGPSPVSK